MAIRAALGLQPQACGQESETGFGLAAKLCPNLCPATRTSPTEKSVSRCPVEEAPVGIEPTNRGFADLCLTTWLRRQEKRKLATHYEFGKSSSANPLTCMTPGGNNGGMPMRLIMTSPSCYDGPLISGRSHRPP